jgi:hypothetical protein
MFSEPVRSSSQISSNKRVKDWDSAKRILSRLDPDDCSFIIFENANRNYIQCAGSKDGLTVEARIYENGEQFKHYRFGRRKRSGKRVKIDCFCGPIRVDKTELLTLEDAEAIMQQFLEDGTFHHSYVATVLSEKYE